MDIFKYPMLLINLLVINIGDKMIVRVTNGLRVLLNIIIHVSILLLMLNLQKAHRPMCRIKQAILQINQQCLADPKLLKLLSATFFAQHLFDLNFSNVLYKKNYNSCACTHGSRRSVRSIDIHTAVGPVEVILDFGQVRSFDLWYNFSIF